jgi:hypothetical protein
VTSFPNTSSTPSPVWCPSSALGCGCSSALTWPTWREARFHVNKICVTWIAHKTKCISVLPKNPNHCFSCYHLPPSSCLMMSFALLYSRQLFCPSVVGEPPCCCDSALFQLRAITHNSLDS